MPPSSPVARCSSCKAAIHWAQTEAGKAIPLDELPSPRGNLVRMDSYRVRVAKADEDPALVRWVSHFATCPNAGAHRKGK